MNPRVWEIALVFGASLFGAAAITLINTPRFAQYGRVLFVSSAVGAAFIGTIRYIAASSQDNT